MALQVPLGLRAPLEPQDHREPQGQRGQARRAQRDLRGLRAATDQRAQQGRLVQRARQALLGLEPRARRGRQALLAQPVEFRLQIHSLRVQHRLWSLITWDSWRAAIAQLARVQAILFCWSTQSLGIPVLPRLPFLPLPAMGSATWWEVESLGLPGLRVQQEALVLRDRRGRPDQPARRERREVREPRGVLVRLVRQDQPGQG